MTNGEQYTGPIKIGIGTGGTTCVITAIRAGDGIKVQPLERQEVQMTKAYATDIKAIRAIVSGLQEKYGPAVSLGFSGPFMLRSDREEIIGSGNLTDWVGKPLVHDLRAMLPEDAILEIGNDVEAQAKLEALTNPQVEGKDFIMSSPGTGIGGAIIRWIDGKPVAFPGEYGHVQPLALWLSILLTALRFKRFSKCGCGKRYDVERAASGSGMEQRWGKPGKDLEDWKWKLAARDMAAGLAEILRIQLVQLVVIGGGIPDKRPQLIPWIRRYLPRFLGFGVEIEVIKSINGKLDDGRAGLALAEQFTLAA